MRTVSIPFTNDIPIRMFCTPCMMQYSFTREGIMEDHRNWIERATGWLKQHEQCSFKIQQEYK